LFAYTAADFAAEGFNLRRRHVTGHRRQGAGEDEVFAGKWSDRSGRAVEFGFEVDAGLSQPIDELTVSRVAMPLHDAVGNNFANVLGLDELIHARGKDRIQMREAASDGLGDAGADVQD